MYAEKKKKIWLELIEEYLSSGKTQREWCAEKNLCERTFNRWYKKYKEGKLEVQGSESIKFIPLEVGSSNELIKKDLDPITIRVGNIAIEVRNNCNKNILFDILSVVKNIC